MLLRGSVTQHVPALLSHVGMRNLKQAEEMFVFRILFWDVWKFGDAGRESNKRQLAPDPVAL